MRLMILALLLSAGPLASGQLNHPAPRNPNPTPCNQTLQFIAPSAGPCVDAQSAAVAIQPATLPTLNWTGPGLTQVKPAIPAQLTARSPNPTQFLALNQLAPQVAPNSSLHAKAEPIPTTWPNAHFEKIPTTWPGLKSLPINHSPSADAATSATTIKAK
jgi:hypothetical protein